MENTPGLIARTQVRMSEKMLLATEMSLGASPSEYRQKVFQKSSYCEALRLSRWPSLGWIGPLERRAGQLHRLGDIRPPHWPPGRFFAAFVSQKLL